MMKKQTAMLAAIEDFRRECYQLVDKHCDALVSQLLEENAECELAEGEHILTLAAMPERFKGKKPVAAILQDCNNDPNRHERMLELRGRVFGNFRSLLAQTPDGMGAPLKIDEGLYWESKFDTEALLRNLTDKLLCSCRLRLSGGGGQVP